MPDNRKNKTGGRKPGAGRPKGAKNINSMASVRKLEELGFDPIEMMVKKYNDIQARLNELDAQGRGGSGAYAQMTATQGTLINNLMAYGTRRSLINLNKRLRKRNRSLLFLLITKNKEGKPMSESGDDDWHLSKSVPISFILAIVIQTFGVVWFMSSLESSVTLNARDIARYEIRLAAVEKTQQELALLNARIDENIKAIREMMEKTRP